MELRIKQSLKFGLFYMLVGIGIGLFISLMAIGDGYQFFYIYSGLSAFLSATSLWLLVSPKKEKISHKRATLIGLLTGIISHYICWYIIIASHYLFSLGQKVFGKTQIEETANLIEAFKISGALTFWSLFFVGWATVIFGIIIANILCKYSQLQPLDKIP